MSWKNFYIQYNNNEESSSCTTEQFGCIHRVWQSMINFFKFLNGWISEITYTRTHLFIFSIDLTLICIYRRVIMTKHWYILYFLDKYRCKGWKGISFEDSNSVTSSLIFDPPVLITERPGAGGGAGVGPDLWYPAVPPHQGRHPLPAAPGRALPPRVRARSPPPPPHRGDHRAKVKQVCAAHELRDLCLSGGSVVYVGGRSQRSPFTAVMKA